MSKVAYQVGFRHKGQWIVSGATMPKDAAKEQLTALSHTDRALYVVNVGEKPVPLALSERVETLRPGMRCLLHFEAGEAA